MGKRSTLLSQMPLRWHFGDVVAKLLKTHDPPLTQAELADRSGLNRNTIGNLIDNAFSPSPETQEKVARGLGITRESILAEVDRINSQSNVVSIRSGRDREEDKDHELKEALDLGRRIRHLGPMERVALSTFVASLEQARKQVQRLEELLAQTHTRERNNHKS
jgi:transcriptional regulator with XRE-family HTH domain